MLNKYKWLNGLIAVIAVNGPTLLVYLNNAQWVKDNPQILSIVGVIATIIGLITPFYKKPAEDVDNDDLNGE